MSYYQLLDNTKRWTYYDDKLIIANKMGYRFVSEAWIKLYVLSKWSLGQIGTKFEVTHLGVRNPLLKWGIKLRSRGGPNNCKRFEIEG